MMQRSQDQYVSWRREADIMQICLFVTLTETPVIDEPQNCTAKLKRLLMTHFK